MDSYSLFTNIKFSVKKEKEFRIWTQNQDQSHMTSIT
jgi:hypothetical protein